MSGDISIFAGRGSLLADLDDVRRFVGMHAIVHVRNRFDLEPKLRASLRDAEPFVSDAPVQGTETITLLRATVLTKKNL